MGITKRQKDVLTFIKRYISENNYPPSIREIASGLNLNSPATVHSHINTLIDKGYLKKTENKFRSLEVVGENEFNTDENVIKVPMLGMITAGDPIEAIENPNEFYNLPKELVPLSKEVFTLKVTGDSMINVGIYDDDVVIIERKSNAQNGEIIVALTDENEVTLKTFYKEKDKVKLQPENDSLKSMYFDNVTILGKAIGLYRKI